MKDIIPPPVELAAPGLFYKALDEALKLGFSF